MHELYDLKEMLCEELKSYSGKELSIGSLDTLDKLAHAIKNLDKIIEEYEEKEMNYRSYEGGNGSYRDPYWNGNNSYARGRSARRDSMGRYSRAAANEDLVRELRGLIPDATSEQIRNEIQKLIDKVEGM